MRKLLVTLFLIVNSILVSYAQETELPQPESPTKELKHGRLGRTLS